MYQGTPEQRERRLAELQSQLDQLTGQLHSVSVATSTLTASERADARFAELETDLHRRLTEVSDQLRVVAAEFHAIDVLEVERPARPIQSSATVGAGRGQHEKATPLWWVAVLLVAVGVVAAGIIVTRLQRQVNTAMARAARAEQETQAGAQIAQQVAATREDATRQLAEAREASQIAAGGLDVGTPSRGSPPRAIVPTIESVKTSPTVGSTAPTLGGASTSPSPALVPLVSSVSPATAATGTLDGNGGLPDAVDLSILAPVPVIGSIVPVSPFVSTSSQTVMVFGSGFQPGLTVTVLFTDNSGSTTPSAGQVQRVTPTSFEIVMPLNSRGAWGIRANSPDGRQSELYRFTVR